MSDRPADDQFVREQSTAEEIDDSGAHEVFSPSSELSDDAKEAAEEAGFVLSDDPGPQPATEESGDEESTEQNEEVPSEEGSQEVTE